MAARGFQRDKRLYTALVFERVLPGGRRGEPQGWRPPGSCFPLFYGRDKFAPPPSVARFRCPRRGVKAGGAFFSFAGEVREAGMQAAVGVFTIRRFEQTDCMSQRLWNQPPDVGVPNLGQQLAHRARAA